MGKLTIIIPDDIERSLRVEVAKRYGGKKGALGGAIAEAVNLWLKENK